MTNFVLDITRLAISLISELFHFRVRVISDTICNYETEFLLFVVDVPLTKTFHNTITVHVGESKAVHDVNERADGLFCKCRTCTPIVEVHLIFLSLNVLDARSNGFFRDRDDDSLLKYYDHIMG